METVTNVLSRIGAVFSTMRFPMDWIDIVLVAVLLYYCLKFIRDARAGQLLKGIVVILVVWLFAKAFDLSAMSYIIDNLIQFGFLAIIVVFQPELRTLLERMGRTNLKKMNLFSPRDSEENAMTQKMIDNVCECVRDLSARHIGGLIVFENSTKLGEIINTGTPLDADITSQTLVTIFFPNTPLHDGAVVLRDFKIAAAGCLLPLTQRYEISSSLGTRHRAAVGMSEVSDAITVVVSEETGKISYTKNGEIIIGVTEAELRGVLMNEFIVKDRPSPRKWFQKRGGEKE